jgi:hypothetical protein
MLTSSLALNGIRFCCEIGPSELKIALLAVSYQGVCHDSMKETQHRRILFCLFLWYETKPEAGMLDIPRFPRGSVALNSFSLGI